MPAQSVTHAPVIQARVESAIIGTFADAEVYINNIPPDRGNKQLCVAVRPIGGPYDSTSYVKRVGFQIVVVANEDEDCVTALDLIFNALKDVEIPSSESGAGTKLVVSATTTPNYDGVDDAGMPVYSCNFELVAIH